MDNTSEMLRGAEVWMCQREAHAPTPQTQGSIQNKQSFKFTNDLLTQKEAKENDLHLIPAYIIASDIWTDIWKKWSKEKIIKIKSQILLQ